MNLNDYFVLSDVLQLSLEEYEALRSYFEFTGIEFGYSFDDIHYLAYNETAVLTVWDSWGEGNQSIIASNSADPDLENCIPMSEIKRMASLGKLT